MPGTAYTRTGPTRDSAGRLADFARFGVEELDAIMQGLNAPEHYELSTVERRADYHAGEALRSLSIIAELLVGFTTADD